MRAYSTDSKAFASHCRAKGLVTLPASTATVAAFLKAEATQAKARGNDSPASLEYRAYTVR